MFDEENWNISDEELQQMSKEDLINVIKVYQEFWNNLPENVKYLNSRIGKLITLVKRDYKPETGVLLRVWYEPVAYELGQVIQEVDYTNNIVNEQRVRTRIQASITLMVREVLEEKKKQLQVAQP
jgi:hypothetical protein